MTTTVPSTSAHRAARTSGRIRAGQIVLTVLLVLCGLVAMSTAFSDDPFPAAAVVLIATFGALAVVFGLVATWSIGHVRAARIAIWALPLFFVVHVAALGTWIPDALLAVMAAAGAALAQPGRTR